MPNQQYDYVEDMINRYVYQVTKHLNPMNKNDIENELRTLISDMLEARTHGNTATKEDILAVLRELGNPSELAEKYRDTSRYLISPEIFPLYLFVLKIVIGATLFGMCIATVLELITSNSHIWYSYLGNWIGEMIGSVGMAFASITILFAILEWKGVNLKEFIPGWEVEELPQVPVKEANIPISEPITGIIFTIIGMVIFTSAPQLLGAYHFDDGGLTAIPVFNMDTFRVVLPLFLITMGLGLLKNIWELVDRRYSIAYAIYVFIINTVSTILTVIIFTRFDIWNSSFASKINEAFHLNFNYSALSAWELITENFIIFLVIIYLLETIAIIVKTIKYNNHFDFMNYVKSMEQKYKN
ncbi:MAG: hypothetical protein K0R34_1127 [Herbinix sp.]|jgi:hypothetical protein|nr:hypothetical protein [Herbinix sp.]